MRRVDNIRLPLSPFFWLYGYGLGFLLYLLVLLLRFTCRIRVEGEELLRDHPGLIYCTWHQNIPCIFVAFHRLRRPQAWMNHPAWFMKPIHVLLWLVGVRRLVLGSTGHNGKEAADRLVGDLRRGYSTLILPDGPHGPAQQLKKGALHMAAQAGLPIVALRVRLSRCFTLGTWDRKRIPYPGSRITLACSPPMFVREEDLEEGAAELGRALG